MVGAVFSPPTQQKQIIPEVVPMRRGRPTVSSQGHAAKPSPSPLRGASGDPFAALDSKSPPGPVDEISARFPSLDQFSLLHDGGKFDFDASSPTKPTHPRDLGQRVTEKLADDAFALPVQNKAPLPTSTVKPSNTVVSRAQKIISSNPELQSTPSPPVVYQPTPTRPMNSAYVSQGTMTSPTPPLGGQPIKYAPSPVQRYPSTSDHHRSASLPRTQDNTPNRSPWLRPEGFEQPLPPRNTSMNLQPGHARHASSSRPSLEGGRPSNEVLDPIARTKSSNSRPRPSSTYLESNMDFLREKESSGRPSLSEKRNSSYTRPDTAVADQSSEEDTNIASNVDFLKSMEDTEASKKDRRRSSGAGNKTKRSSLPSMSLSGTKNLLAGKFGDAFKRFEHNTNTPPGPRTPSPLQDLERRDLTPIAGSEATDGRSDDGRLEDMDNLPPEQRRELERRRLSMEEKRVANAAAEYRKRLAERGTTAAPRSIGGVSRATSIQNKVKTLLDENQQPSPKKTAEGYGRFTDDVPPSQANAFQSQMPVNPYAKPAVARKPIIPGVVHARTTPIQQPGQEIDYSKPRAQQSQPPITSPAVVSKTGGPRPNAPPKPMHLNSISTGGQQRSNDVLQNSPPKSSGFMQGRQMPLQAGPDMTPQEKEDYIADFSKRFPSLSGIEMVEREIEGVEKGGVRSRDV
jgi:AP2-associated kinase